MTKVGLDDGTAVNYTYSNGVVSSIVRDSLLPDGTTKQSQTYSFTYDKYGNVTAVKVGSKTLASYTYMANNGPLTKVTYPNGYTIEYGHDALGRVVTETRDGVLKYRYVYGSEGDLSRKEELNSSGTVVKATCYEYDSLDRLIRSWEETLSGGYLQRGLITQHLYDTANRLTGQSWRLTDGTSKSESYTYNSKDGTLSSMVTASGKTISLSYDHLKRLESRSDGQLTVSYGYLAKNSAHTTTRVNQYTNSGLTSLDYSYTYDKLGNITQIKQNGTVIANYTYDAQSQLIQEVLPQQGITYEYSYDTAGNIREVKTTQNGTTTTKSYSYAYSSFRDAVSEIDGHTLAYDANNNPKTYYNGQEWTFTWKEGRQLATAASGSTSVSYNYDAEGLRTSKTVGSTTYNYTYLGNKLVRQTWGSNKIDFAYDDQGRPYSLTYNGTTYFYVLNLQGDVIRIVNSGGNVAADYTYDAWGNVLSAMGTLADVNPLRYRGYVYDRETGLYYLNSRYYDPENRRFVNADSVDVLAIEQGSAVQYNLFAYSLNNPVTLYDSGGQFALSAVLAISAKILVGAGIGAATGAIWGGVVAFVTGGDVVESLKSGAISGAITGGLGAIGPIGTVGKAIISGAISAKSYIDGHPDDWNGFGLVAASISGGLASAYLPNGLGFLPDFVSSFTTGGGASLVTEMMHYVGIGVGRISKKIYTPTNAKKVRTPVKSYRSTSNARFRVYSVPCLY
ncbi:MAG: RHS repeat domain-containing protein [Candidatus Onthomonas sp.]